MSDSANSPALPRWAPIVTMIVAALGFLVTAIGVVVTIGSWRGEVDSELLHLDSRMDVAEADARVYTARVIAMESDMRYLADRARREDGNRERQERQERGR